MTAAKAPRIAHLRNPNVRVEIASCGTVTALGMRRPRCRLAQCSPDSPVFEAFMRFWGGIFSANSTSSLGLTQLIMDMAAGRIRQDSECPFLFHDLSRPLQMDGGARVFPVLEVTLFGIVRAYNPDPCFMNEAVVMEDDPQIMAYPNIEDFEGHDIVNGMVYGVRRTPGERPEFDKRSQPWTPDAPEIAAGLIKASANSRGQPLRGA